MPKSSAQVTAAEISRLAGVTRATVSNWRRRHQDFPAPSGGTDASPLYDLPAVFAWLETRGHSSTASSAEELRSALRLAPGGSATRLLPFVLAAARHGGAEALTGLAALPAADLAARARKAVTDLADAVPAADTLTYRAADADLLRSLLRCVRDEGGRSALDVLAERELEDSAASGAYATPEPLTDLMARLVTPAGGRPYPARVLDPACGTGSLLTSAARLGATRLYGQDIIQVQAQRTAVRLRLTTADTADTAVTVRSGDTLRADAFPDLTVDAVLCQPPYGDRDWGHDELAYDPRWAYGVPPRMEPELAWNQHALSHLVPGGRAVMLLPPATASRTSGRRVRVELLRSGAVRAVIALPPGAASPLHIGLHLWVLQRPEPSGTDRQRVLFIDTAGDQRGPADRDPFPRTGGGRGTLGWEALTSLLLTHWRAFDADPAAFTDEPGIARAVPVIDLLDDLTDITPARHVRVSPNAADPAAAAKDANDLRARLDRGVTALAGAVARTGWQPAGDEPRSWRTATVADLARGGALTIHRAARGPADAEPPAAYAGLPVLTGHDVATGARASATTGDLRLTSTVTVEAGDVLLPAVVGAGPGRARVADDLDEGALLGLNVHLFRPDPERLDPWFLAGFLSAEDNVSSASTGTTSVQIDPRRLRLPLLPLAEQCEYGEAFRRLYELRAATGRAADLAADTARLLTAGLTTGALLPANGTA
jgi:hypothetical protein